MNKGNCALKLVDEIILYYDARSKKHRITLGIVFQNLEKRIQVCLDVNGDHFQHQL